MTYSTFCLTDHFMPESITIHTYMVFTFKIYKFIFNTFIYPTNRTFNVCHLD